MTSAPATEASDQAVPAASAGREHGGEPWGAVGLLLVVGILNYLDRVLPSILTEPIRHDLQLSDTALGIINGTGFLLVYAIAGIPISRWADRGRYAVVITASLALWSLMTMLGSMARSGWQFGVTRIGVALGEAGSTPSAHAFVSRRFSLDRRARALAIIGMGGPLGTMAGLVGGGYLGSLVGWRATFAIMGIAGLALAPIAYLVLRGGRAAGEVAPPEALPQSRPGRWTDLFRTRSGTYLVIAASLVATGGYGTLAFNPAFLMRAHGLSIAETGAQLGIATGLAGVVIMLISGAIIDRLARNDARWTIGVVGGTTFLAVPTAIVGYLTSDATLAVVCTGLSAAFMNGYVPPTVLALYRLVPVQVRARTSATLLFATAVLGSFGPPLVGRVSDSLASAYGEGSLGYAMLLVPAFYTLAVVFYYAASRNYRADMIREPD